MPCCLLPFTGHESNFHKCSFVIRQVATQYRIFPYEYGCTVRTETHAMKVCSFLMSVAGQGPYPRSQNPYTAATDTKNPAGWNSPEQVRCSPFEFGHGAYSETTFCQINWITNPQRRRQR